MVMKDIETGVDKLVSLIANKKSVDLDAAAKELGVSESVVREWAEFLEEEGIISIEYGLSKVTLLEKILTKKEAESKVKEYHSKKDAFVRKVETTLRALESETEEFDLIKAEFEDLKKKIGTEMEDVKEELDELRHYEDLKQNIDNDIKRQKQEYLELIDKARKEIRYEENRYSSLLTDVGKEREELVKEKKEILQLEEKEDHLRKKLEAIYGIIKSIENQINGKKSTIDNAEEHIVNLQKMAENVENEIKNKKKNIIEPLIKKSQEQTEKISVVQDLIIEKIKKKEMKIETYSEESKKIADKFRKFFDKKVRTESLLGKIEDDRHMLEDQLKELIKKAQAFDAIAKKTNAKVYIAELMKNYDQIEKGKSLLRRKLEQLAKIVRGE
ncbi:MAG: hypothetical protein ISS25_04365 [Nanoarchaeota archaeon]|nr:hypothetical protein [DPANN group archaeon]MBL7117035.1 hypothetical protein [Nanoarchaeota archaeon]